MDKKILKFLYKYTLPKSEFARYCASRDNLPVLAGLYYNEGNIIASNSKVLIVIKQDYDPILEGRVLAQKVGILSRYPDYKGLISHAAKNKYEDLAGFLKACKNLERPSTEESILCVNVNNVCFNPSLVLELVKIFGLLKEDFELYIQSGAYHSCLQSASCTIIIAPYFNVDPMNNISVENALAYGDLL